MPREKSRYREKRSSSYSSDSSHERRKSKIKSRRRSRSRDRSESSNHKRRHSSSRSKYKRRSYSRSLSRDRDRYEPKYKRRSSSRPRTRKDRSQSRSSSRSRSKYSKSSKKSSKRSRSSSSRSSSIEIVSERPQVPKVIPNDTMDKIEKAIRAAEAAGVSLTKIPTYEFKSTEVKEDMPTIHDRNLIAELNSDSFVQKSFVSSKNKKQNIVIDLDTQTVKVPESDVKPKDDDSIIDANEIPCEEDLKEMWIKKLYLYRKKMLKGET